MTTRPFAVAWLPLLLLMLGCPAQERLLPLADDILHGPGSGKPGDDDDDDDTQGDSVTILRPEEGSLVANPVNFEFQVTGSVQTVEFFCDGHALQDEPIQVGPGLQVHTYEFSGINEERTVDLLGYNATGQEIVSDDVAFTPAEGLLPEPPGFNGYVARAINDWSTYPKNGTYPYCWSYYGDECGDMWGMIWGLWYVGEDIFPGGLDCFCSGHTLEVFFDAFERWQADNGEPITTPYGDLTVGSVDVGDFYQYWQGFGVATYASAADAFEDAGIGEHVYEEDWGDAQTGDFVNLSRDTGSGHSVIFVDWVWEGGNIAGLRYYGCNGSGDSNPDPDDPSNTSSNSGPSFVTEYFTGYGGSVLTNYLFIGHPYDPTDL